MNIELNHSKWKEYNFNDIFTEYSKTNTENLEQFTVGKYGLTTKLTDVCSYDIQNHKVFEPNTLLIGIGAEEVGVSVTEHGCVSPIYNTFKISNDFDSLFLKYLMPIIILQNKYKISHISTRRDYEIETSKLSKIKILLPSFEAQKEISRLLYLVDNKIENQDMTLTKLKQLKQSLLELMFPSNNSNFPQLRFNNFTSPWEQCKLGDVVEIGSGMDYKHLGEGDIPVYGTGGYMLSVDSALSKEKDAVGIGRKGTIDKPYILRAPFWTVDTLFYCIPKENHDLDFINCLFQTVDWKKKDESTGVPSLSRVIINNVEAIMPSFNEQKKIGVYFSSLNHLITLHQCK